MARGAAFEFLVLYHPKPVKDAAQNDVTPASTIIVEKKMGVFSGEKEAALKASRAIPPDYEDKLEFCEVRVRPF